MKNTVRRRCAAAWFQLRRVPQRNRRVLYDGRHGLRILTFHATPAGKVFDRFRRIIEWCGEHLDIVGPEAADALIEGRAETGNRDKILGCFDDGHETNHAAAVWLAERGIRAVFFVVPSFLEHTLAEFLEYHRANGVQASRFFDDLHADRGLGRSQVSEMMAMGHRIAAHNFAHRDLGKLHEEIDLEYEIDRALQAVAELTEQPCEDFAFGFGHARHISTEAAEFLNTRCKRVYACVRGLNIPGSTPRYFLRDGTEPTHPFSFIKLCLNCGADAYRKTDWEYLRAISGTMPVDQSAAPATF